MMNPQRENIDIGQFRALVGAAIGCMGGLFFGIRISPLIELIMAFARIDIANPSVPSWTIISVIISLGMGLLGAIAGYGLCKQVRSRAAIAVLLIVFLSILTVAYYGSEALFRPRKEYPLIVALESGDISNAKTLIAEKVDIDRRDGSGRTVLMIAADKGYSDIIELLLKAGVDVNARDSSGNTALTVAVVSNRLDIVKILIASGANPNVPIYEGPLEEAVILNKKDIVELLVKAGVNVNNRNRMGLTPLMYATSREMAEILINLSSG